jgi:hypothetical protein
MNEEGNVPHLTDPTDAAFQMRQEVVQYRPLLGETTNSPQYPVHINLTGRYHKINVSLALDSRERRRKWRRSEGRSVRTGPFDTKGRIWRDYDIRDRLCRDGT